MRFGLKIDLLAKHKVWKNIQGHESPLIDFPSLKGWENYMTKEGSPDDVVEGGSQE